VKFRGEIIGRMLGRDPELKNRWGLLYLTTKAFYELKVSQCLKGVYGNKESVREKKGVGMGHGSGGVCYRKGRTGMDRVSALRRIV
jgi:hypothetical protein